MDAMHLADADVSLELARRLVRESWRLLSQGDARVDAQRIAGHTTLPVAFVRETCERAGLLLSTSEP